MRETADGRSYKNGCEVQERQLDEICRSLGEDHPETLTAMLDLADCLWAQGRLIAARKLEEQVVEGRRRLLGNLDEARQLQEQVVSGRRTLFGDTNLETLRAINNLAGTISAQGDFTRARELLVSVLATTCREYGEQHPDSLTTMSNLAAILWQEGDRAEAYALQQQVVEMRSRLQGEDDPATRAAAAVIEMMERDPGY